MLTQVLSCSEDSPLRGSEMHRFCLHPSVHMEFQEEVPRIPFWLGSHLLQEAFCDYTISHELSLL